MYAVKSMGPAQKYLYAQSHKNKFTDLIFARDGCYC